MQVLRIKQASCKNCYKCVRICPVKAIRIKDGQATVDGDHCILCGQCWRACPQQAKEIVSDRQAVNNLLQGSAPVFVSLAPSLAATWPGSTPGQLVTALLRLGFSGVSQTAAGAALVNVGYQQLLDQAEVGGPLLSTACPAVVNVVERYYPELVQKLAPLPSPLIVHARLIKRFYPGARVVFIGPCLAKKAEVARPEYIGAVDAVLLASELAEWLQSAALNLRQLPESDWLPLDGSVAALYPEHGGLLRYLQVNDKRTTAVAGADELQDLFHGMQSGQLTTDLVECNACSGGCLNGPDIPLGESLLRRKELLHQYDAALPAGSGYTTAPLDFPLAELFQTDYRPHPVEQPDFPEEQIQAALRRVGKYSSDQELNCGACGYGSCREKAKAVLAGMAEPEMCMPYMRSQAESMANLVMQTTPNALIVVDRQLNVQEFNPAAERMWQRQAASVKGQPLQLVMADDDFRAVRDGGSPVVGKVVRYPELGLITSQSILSLAGETELLLGVVTDITEMVHQSEELAVVKAETVARAQEVIDKQMRVTQEIAGLLGEVTADSKMQLLRLIRLVQGEGNLR